MELSLKRRVVKWEEFGRRDRGKASLNTISKQEPR